MMEFLGTRRAASIRSSEVPLGELVSLVVEEAKNVSFRGYSHG